jgi:putative transposase
VPRKPRIAPGGHFFHVLNRAGNYNVLFEGPRCYREFLSLIAEVADSTNMRILAYCLMPNHWHMLLWPRQDDDLRRYVQRLTTRHAHLWHLKRGSVGRGHLYQGRFKSFIVQDDGHLLTVCRYIERNPLRANLVTDATRWPWSSAPERLRTLRSPASPPSARATANALVQLEPFIVPFPSDWAGWLNEPQTEAELARIRLHVRSSSALGLPQWTETVIRHADVGKSEVGAAAAGSAAASASEIQARFSQGVVSG